MSNPAFNPRHPLDARMRGVSLIEVLIALVVLMIGLLPLGALMARTHRAELESYERKQTIVFLENMVDRLNANHNAASCYAITSASGSPYLGDGSSTTGNCTAGGGIPSIPSTTEASRANTDLAEWNDSLLGTSEVSGSTNIGGALKARGCITNDGIVGGDPNLTQYTVSVAWLGTTDQPLPTSASTCAKDSYGADTLRRVISVIVRVPILN